MIGKAMLDEFNRQINEEMFSSYLYLSIAAWFEDINMKGAAMWMRAQSDEETMHANKFFDYILVRGGKVELLPIEGPKKEWTSPLDAFEASYEHEHHISARINTLMDLAVKEKDYAAQAFLQWFVNEQVEEEASVDEVVQKLKMVGDSKNGLFMIDRELAARGASSHE
ncbi:MAG: ferritin [Synergistota bacterium]|nr:ferritin [Synergistota bacterium]